MVDGFGQEGVFPSQGCPGCGLRRLSEREAAFNWNGIWSLNTLAENKALEWGVAPLPQIGELKAVWANSHQFTIPTQRNGNSNRVDAAKVFVNWVSQQSLEWARGGQIPARNSVRESDGFAKLTGQSTLAKQINDVVFPPTVPGINDVIGEFYRAVNEIVLGGKGVESTLKESASRADKILEENRKKYQ